MRLIHRLPLCGITPACAGKRAVGAVSDSHARNHPRVRGEEWSSHESAIAELESPPRARGRGGDGARDADTEGITPACAGKSLGGEVAVKHRVESPPRARGRVTVWSMVTQDEGITPACAGKSLRLPRLAGLVGNHPRVRGEEAVDLGAAPWLLESPPRARGRGGGVLAAVANPRNHPRVRGEEDTS